MAEPACDLMAARPGVPAPLLSSHAGVDWQRWMRLLLPSGWVMRAGTSPGPHTD